MPFRETDSDHKLLTNLIERHSIYHSSPGYGAGNVEYRLCLNPK